MATPRVFFNRLRSRFFISILPYYEHVFDPLYSITPDCTGFNHDDMPICIPGYNNSINYHKEDEGLWFLRRTLIVNGEFYFRGISNYTTLIQYANISTSTCGRDGKFQNNSKIYRDGGDAVEGKSQGIRLSWIDLYIPKYARPYAHLARLDRPIGTWLLALPCLWSITLAAGPGSLPDVKMVALFSCGALLLRGAGCTVNDLLDQDIDRKIERTKERPIANGVLTPFRGLCFLGIQLSLGFGILLQLNNYSRLLGASSLLLVFSYPLMKRITFWPQAFLGLTFNWGTLLGWAAIKGSLDLPIVLPLYASGVFWTLVYDTIYAHQDKHDDLKVGVKSTALLFGDSTKIWLSVFGTACVGSLVICGLNCEIGWPYYMFLASASGQLIWQIWKVDLSCRDDCNRKFVSNKWFGIIVFGGILVGKLTS